MNTPLLQLLATAVRSLDGLRTSRHYSDARNYQGPRDVPPAEAAGIIAQALGPFALDWRRVEDGLPEEGVAVMIAAEYLRQADGSHRNFAVGEATLHHSRGRFIWDDNSGAAPNVFAWAPMPKAPDRAALVGFRPRPFA